MGCTFPKKVEETVFYKFPPKSYVPPPKDQKKFEGYFFLKEDGVKADKFYLKFYKNGDVTLSASKTGIITYLMKINQFEFQPDFKVVDKNTQTVSLQQSPTKKLQMKQIENLKTNRSYAEVMSDSNGKVKSPSAKAQSQNGIPSDSQQLQLIGIRLIKNENVLVLRAEIQENLFLLRRYLNNKLVQRGFQFQYKIVKKLGQGGFAAVYLVIKRENNEKFAAKIFSKESLRKEKDGVEALQNEIQIMRSLKHVNLLRVHEVFSSQSSVYLIMDVHTGGTLEDKIKNKEQITSRNVRVIVRQLLYGLEYMHKKRIMHRDIKPENIIFKNGDKGNYQCTIADFGLATRIDIEKYMYTKCGTPGFVAPEVWEYSDHMRYNEQCDVFSVGIIFHILLLGFSPFDDQDLAVCIRKNRKGTINWSNEEYQRLKPETLDLLRQMLLINPAKRITPQKSIAHKYFESKSGTYYYQNEQISKKETLRLNLVGGISEQEDMIDSPLAAHKGFQTPKLKKEGLKKKMRHEMGSEQFDMAQTPIMKGRDQFQFGEEQVIASPVPSSSGMASPKFNFPPPSSGSHSTKRRQSKFAKNPQQFVFPGNDNSSLSSNSPKNRDTIHAQDYIDEQDDEDDNPYNVQKQQDNDQRKTPQNTKAINFNTVQISHNQQQQSSDSDSN